MGLFSGGVWALRPLYSWQLASASSSVPPKSDLVRLVRRSLPNLVFPVAAPHRFSILPGSLYLLTLLISSSVPARVRLEASVVSRGRGACLSCWYGWQIPFIRMWARGRRREITMTRSGGLSRGNCLDWEDRVLPFGTSAWPCRLRGISQFLAMAFHFAQRVDRLILRFIIGPRTDFS
jgi:hypothetical protein